MWKFGFHPMNFTSRVNWWRLTLKTSAFQTFHGVNLTFINSYDWNQFFLISCYPGLNECKSSQIMEHRLSPNYLETLFYSQWNVLTPKCVAPKKILCLTLLLKKFAWQLLVWSKHVTKSDFKFCLWKCKYCGLNEPKWKKAALVNNSFLIEQ